MASLPAQPNFRENIDKKTSDIQHEIRGFLMTYPGIEPGFPP